MCVEPSGISCKGALIPAVKGSGGGHVTARVTPGWSQLLQDDIKRNLGDSVWRKQQLTLLTFDSPRANDITQFTSSFLDRSICIS